MSILFNQHEFNFSETYAYADKVRKHIFDEGCDIEIIGLASDYENQITKPQKWTLLHDYINHIVTEDIDFNFGGPAWGYDCVEPLFPILDAHGVEYKTLQEYVEQQLRDAEEEVQITDAVLERYESEYALYYLRDIAIEGLTPVLVKEVFTLLFGDRVAMKEFNIKVANEIGEKTERCTYWNSWLETALFYREKGQCAICKTDLSSLFNTQAKPAIDHIVPINLNGVNDPTNLQMLCRTCNGKKSGTEIVTSNYLPLYWE